MATIPAWELVVKVVVCSGGGVALHAKEDTVAYGEGTEGA